MATIRVTKFYEFEMSHALWNYDGLCKNIHGHSYKLYVTVSGTPIHDIEHKKNGMVIDFSDLKKIVKERIVDRFDHSLMISSRAPHEKLLELEGMYERHHVVDFQPTCENLVLHFVDIIRPLLPVGIKLQRVTLYETANSSAEWDATDNQSS
ncbi:MAG TPA: 6-carboxytetrahydropterin synthase [Prolixibacteraceae bacterium]|nr:6-carboxytetrahydropterin synthase [Prolixibacteraceae bacterium]